MVQVPPSASIGPSRQSLDAMNSGSSLPNRLIAAMVSGASPVLVTVTLWLAEVSPKLTVPRSSWGVDSAMMGPVLLVPLTGTDWVPILVAMSSEAVFSSVGGMEASEKSSVNAQGTSVNRVTPSQSLGSGLGPNRTASGPLMVMPFGVSMVIGTAVSFCSVTTMLLIPPCAS